MIHHRMRGTPGVVLLSPQALPSSPLHPIGALPISGLGWCMDCQEQGLPKMCVCPSACDATDEPRSESTISCSGSSGAMGVPMAMMTGIPGKVPAFVTQDRGEGHSGVWPCSPLQVKETLPLRTQLSDSSLAHFLLFSLMTSPPFPSLVPCLR